MLLLPETKLDSEKLLEPQMLEISLKIKNFNQAPVSGSIQVHLSLQVRVTSLEQLSVAEFSCKKARPKVYKNNNRNVLLIWLDKVLNSKFGDIFRK